MEILTQTVFTFIVDTVFSTFSSKDLKLGEFLERKERYDEGMHSPTN